MIWLRRILAFPLILLFIPLFLVILVVFRVNDTALSADFYIDQLRKADIFTFMYDDVAPAALKEVNKEPQNLPIPINVEKVGNKGVSLAREVFPPGWLEKQAEQAILQVVPYVVGGEDSFAINIQVGDRLETLGDVLKRELGGGETYNLLFDDVIAPALKDAFEENSTLTDLPFGITITSQDIVAAVQEVMPPQWVQARVGHVVDQVVPYLTGQADHFAIQIPVADRLEASAPVLKKLLVNIKAYEVLNSQEFAEAVEKQLTEFGELPFGMKLTSAQVVSAVQTVAPPQWLQTQVEHILDEMVPYATGKQDGFEVVVPLKDRIQVAVPVVKQLLRDVNAYNLLFDQVVVKLVNDNLGQQAALPLGLTLTSDDIVPVLRKTLPPEFIQTRAENMIDQVAPYLTGEAQGFKVMIPLKDRKQAAVAAIQELADKKLKELVARMKPCTVTEALELLQGGFSGALPPCLPKGYSLEEVKQALDINIPGITQAQIEKQLGISLTIVINGVTPETIEESFGIDLAGQVSQFVINAIPDEFTFTDVDLRNVLGEDHEKTLNQALDYTRNGYTFTDADLRSRLNAEQRETLDQVLDWTRNGFTYTDADLREDLVGENGDTTNLETLDQVLEWTRHGVTFTDADLRELAAGDEEAGASFEQFEQARKWLGLVRSLWFVPLLVLAGLLAAIGFLGGRGWRSRVVWAAVPLGFAAGIAFAAFGPVYHGIAEPIVDDALAEVTRDTTGVQQLVAEKGVDVVKAVVNDFFAGLANRALLLLIIGVLAVALAILWPTLYRLVRGGPREEPAPPHLGAEEREREELGQPGPGRTGEA